MGFRRSQADEIPPPSPSPAPAPPPLHISSSPPLLPLPIASISFFFGASNDEIFVAQLSNGISFLSPEKKKKKKKRMRKKRMRKKKEKKQQRMRSSIFKERWLRKKMGEFESCLRFFHILSSLFIQGTLGSGAYEVCSRCNIRAETIAMHGKPAKKWREILKKSRNSMTAAFTHKCRSGREMTPAPLSNHGKCQWKLECTNEGSASKSWPRPLARVVFFLFPRVIFRLLLEDLANVSGKRLTLTLPPQSCYRGVPGKTLSRLVSST